MTKRFEVLNHYGVPKSVYDSEKDDVFGIGEVVGLLNQLHQENLSLKEQLKQKQEEEKLYAREIVELNKTKNEMLNFKELGGDY